MRSDTPDPGVPTEVTCAASYFAGNDFPVPVYGFVFRVPSTVTRFTLYASKPDRYVIDGIYRLTISEPTDVPLHLTAGEAELLRRCLLLVEDHWRQAIGQTDAGAARPESDRTPEPGFINIEPYPSGYKMIGNAFRDELANTTRLREQVERLLSVLLNPDGDPS